MKKNNFKISILVFVLVSLFGFALSAKAENGVYVSPASANKTVGDIYDIAVGVGATESKVYAVEGTLVFNNLQCKSITIMDNGVVAQAFPTCAKPYFLVGVPGGTTSGTLLFTITVKASNEGTATVGFTGVDVIGAGSSVSKVSVGGSYQISVATPAPVVLEKTQSNQKTSNVTEVKTVTKTSVQEGTRSSAEVAQISTTEVPTSTSVSGDQTATSILGLGWFSWKFLIWAFVALVLIGVVVYFFRWKKEDQVE